MNSAGRPDRLDSRRIDLDWLRIGAFALLVPYHVGMLYVPWPYHAKSLHVVPWLTVLMTAVNPWRLLLLFFISGVATHHMAARRTPMSLLAARSRRLLIPLLFGMAFIVPPQVWVQAKEQLDASGSYADFLRRHHLGLWGVLCRRRTCLVLPAWNHLWFVAYLWIYTVVACLVSVVLRLGAPVSARLERIRSNSESRAVSLAWSRQGDSENADTALSDVLSRSGGLLVVPPALLGLARWELFDSFPPNQALWGDWYAHAIFATGFAMGYAIADRPVAWAAMERRRWGAAAVATFVFLLVATGTLHPSRLSDGVMVPIYQWTAIVALCGFARRHLAHRGGPVLRYLREAVFPCYILHQTVIVLLACLLRSLHWTATGEAGAIMAGTVAISLLGFELVCRVAWLRPLFGLGPKHMPRPLNPSGPAPNRS